MIGFIAILSKYRRVIAFAAILIALGVSHYMAYREGIQAEKMRTMIKVVNIREKQIEIRNNRPDDTALLNSLHNGKF